MGAAQDKQFERFIAYLANQLGGDIPRNLIEVAVAAQDSDLTVRIEDPAGNVIDPRGILDTGDSEVDPATEATLSNIEGALNDVGTALLVDQLSGWNVGVLDQGGGRVSPINEEAIGPLEQSTATAEPGQIDLGSTITDVDVFLDLSAVNADWVFEVSLGGTNWREHTRVVSGDLSTGGEFFQVDTSFQFARSRYLGTDSDVDTHETSAKGVS